MGSNPEVEAIMKSSIWIGIVAVAAAVSTGASAAQLQRERSGRETVQEVCVRCHGTGEQGAPRIGDTRAWKARSERGLTGLTQSAIKGVRNMPPHGGRFDLSDVELERAITYMVNQSGGKWTEPIGAAGASTRSGKQIVSAQCSQCHQEGKGGAPKIGDRAAWIPRLTHGFDAAVSSAIHGHGGMPARGGLPDLTDGEVRAAIAYMLNPDPPQSR
jgi:cytochrome c5